METGEFEKVRRNFVKNINEHKCQPGFPRRAVVKKDVYTIKGNIYGMQKYKKPVGPYTYC
jgi:hypothetical protein